MSWCVTIYISYIMRMCYGKSPTETDHDEFHQIGIHCTVFSGVCVIG